MYGRGTGVFEKSKCFVRCIFTGVVKGPDLFSLRMPF